MEPTWQPQWQAQWGGADATHYMPSQPATGVVTPSMTQALTTKQGGTKVEIRMACKDLVNLDTFSKSDPMCVVYAKEADNKWKEVGRTEVIWDNLNPKWVTSFKLPYHFEKVQPLMFKVYDIDNQHATLDQQDFIGHAECRLSELMTASGQTLVLTLVNEHKPNRRNGKIIVMGEEINDTISQEQVASLNVRDKYIVSKKEFHRFKFSAHGLDRKDLFGKSDPFFVILRSRETGRSGESDNWVPVYKSETIKFTLNPNWAPFEIAGETLNNGDPKRPLLIQVWDWNRSGAHAFIGQVETDTDELYSSSKGDLALINNKKKAQKKKYHDSGLLRVEVLNKELRQQRIQNPYYGYNAHSFLEYIAGGCQISLIIAIDFTASNGSPKDPTSLHYLDPSGRKQNEYVAAITSVGQILSDYDSDKRYPVYGFGGKKKADGKGGAAHHCFALNGNESDPEVQGIDGVLRAYEKAFEHWILSGPTNFAEIVATAADMAKAAVQEQRQNHFILLILTDGIISDMRETTREIVRASVLPLSIVIVGVGEADFKDMDVLDADDTPLVYNGQEMERDIVQFVPFREFRNNPQQLAEETLQEIPWQLTSFMAINNIAPNPRSAFMYPPSSRGSMGLMPPGSGAVPFPASAAQPAYPPGAAGAAGLAAPSPQQQQQQQQQYPQQPQQQPPQWGASGPAYPQPPAQWASQAGAPPAYQSQQQPYGGPPFYPQSQQQPQWPQGSGGPQWNGQAPSPYGTPTQQQQQQMPYGSQPYYGQQQQQQQPPQGGPAYPDGQQQQPPSPQGYFGGPPQQPPQGGPAYPDGQQPPQAMQSMQHMQPTSLSSSSLPGYAGGLPPQQQPMVPPSSSAQQPQPTQQQEAQLDDQLEELLSRLGYLNFRDVFLKEKLTYEALKEFEKDDLKELGLPAGPRIAIYNAMHKTSP